MNPIEHVWEMMKEILYRGVPGLMEITGREVNIQAFTDALKLAWNRVPLGPD